MSSATRSLSDEVRSYGSRGEMTREFLIVLRILTDDPDDDATRWPYDEMLASPEPDEHRHVKYVTGSEVKRP